MVNKLSKLCIFMKIFKKINNLTVNGSLNNRIFLYFFVIRCNCDKSHAGKL